MTLEELLRRVAGYGLPGTVDLITEEPLDDGEWRSLLPKAVEQRLVGYLQAAVEQGAFAVTDRQRQALAESHLQCCAQAVRLDRSLVRIVDLLEARGIDAVVLKGTASAHVLYTDPAMRVFADNDVLLRSEQYEAALSVLIEGGYRRQTAEARSGFERRFAKGTTLTGPGGDDLDIHRNLVFGTFGFAIELEELFRSNVEFEVGGSKLKALSPEARLLHACYHAAIGDPKPRYSSVRDIAQILAVGGHDEARVIELAERWRSMAVLRRAVELCRGHLGVSLVGPLVDTIDAYEPSSRERRAIASYVGSNRHFAAKVVASLPYIEGVGAKISFLRGAALPDPEFARSHGGEPGLPWLQRGIRSLFQRGP